ncbi:MAG: hypothetical protein ACPGVG_18465, partial [Mycobacterium sp.]
DSEGMKNSVFPCATDSGLVMQGDAIASAGVVDELMHIIDLPKTIIDLAGGNYLGQPDGVSFADCVDGTMTPANCNIEREVSCTDIFTAQGGSNGDLQRPPNASDAADVWTRWERECKTASYHATETYMIRRVMDVGLDGAGALVITEYCEEFYVMHGTGDMLPAADAPRAFTGGGSSRCHSSGVANGGSLVPGDFSTITATEAAALPRLQWNLDRMLFEDGAYSSTSWMNFNNGEINY